MQQMYLAIEHRAAMPWCYYDKSRKKIVLRLKCSSDVQAIKLLYGDPYRLNHSAAIHQWDFAEAELQKQFCGTSNCVWKIELDVPHSKRLKYGFKLKTASGELYLSENGAEPFNANAVNHSHFYFPFIHEVDALQTVDWVKDTIWYQIFPDRFCRKAGTENEANVQQQDLEDWEAACNSKGKTHWRSFFGGNLKGIREKLPYLANLGINGIYLTPVFTSPSNHKYNIQDYFSIDPFFGNLNEMKALVNEAHSLNIRVMLDAVFNHAGSTHPFWLDVLEKQEASVYRDYFHIHKFPIRQHDPGKSSHELDFHTFAWVPRMPKWNTENPQTRKYLLDSAAYWIKECDIDGWRLDVANEVSFDFWKEFSALVRSLKKDFYIVGEIWHDASVWINQGFFDAVMNYPLQAAISNCFISKKTDPKIFTEQLFAVLARYSDFHNNMSFNLLDSHDTDRVISRASGDKQALRNAFTMMFLLPGSPCLYYGTEVGMEGEGDPDCRRPMIWNEKLQDLALHQFFQRLIEFRKKYLPLISNSVVSYNSEKNVHYWVFSSGGESLIAVYSEKPVCNFAKPGLCVFEPEADSTLQKTGELPPETIFVFYKGNE